MKRSTVAALVLLAIGVGLLSDLTWRKRKQERELRDDEVAADRYVDAGVMLQVVVQDDAGAELVPGKPPLRVLRCHHFGGVIDTRARPPRLIAPSAHPRMWFCSEDQEAALLHTGPELGQLIYGSEGAGKTTLLAQWHFLRWLEHLGERREGGQTAPTRRRLKLFRDEVFRLWHPSWYEHRKAADVFLLCDGTRIQLVSTHRQSKEQGSPIQGYNWSWCGRDELQDQLDAHADIESRGRAAKQGRFLQIASATVKDSPAFRTLCAELRESGEWLRRYLLIGRSPFVSPAFLASKRRVMTDREFRRRFLAEDLPPENAVYFAWQRDADGRRLNLRPIPTLGARRITSIVLSRKTGNRAHDLLVGHDPGTAKAASIWLDAFQIGSDPDPVWWVRGELFTRHRTSEQHALALLEKVRGRGCNLGRIVNGRLTGPPEIAHVRAQPVGQAQDKPDLDVYRVFSRIGLDIKAAQYKKDGTGTGHIAKDSRVEVINRLLCDADGRRRLFVECDELGRPVAPRLIEAFESMERDDKGRAEQEAKDEHDLSDVPAALGYALWPFEKEAATALRATIRKDARS